MFVMQARMFSCIQEKSITKISKNSRVSFYLCMRDQSDDILIYLMYFLCSRLLHKKRSHYCVSINYNKGCKKVENFQ